MRAAQLAATGCRRVCHNEVRHRNARMCLAAGRHSEALAALRRARGAARGEGGARLALVEGDALLGLMRFREALSVASRALRRRAGTQDVTARLRLLRGQAFWGAGSTARGRAEARRAARDAEQPLTHGRLHEIEAFLAWKAREPGAARDHLGSARRVYAGQRWSPGLLRVLATEAGLDRDAGAFDDALEVHDRRMALATALGRADQLAQAHAERGDLLAYLGRWREASADLVRSAELFRRLSDPGEFSLAGVRRVPLELALGDLEAARRSLEEARQIDERNGDSPPVLAEKLLLASDVELAAGRPEAADREAGEALKLYVGMADRDGESRAHVRRAHARLALERLQEALREARRALRAVSEARDDLRFLAEFTLGRALLRARPAAALAVFESAVRVGHCRPGLLPAAHLGLALARGASSDSQEVRAALAELEAFGDQRVLSYCRAELERLRGEAAVHEPRYVATCGSTAAQARLGLEAAAAVSRGGAPQARWAAAMRAVEPALAWSRAVLLTGGGWELVGSAREPRPLGKDDPIWRVAARVAAPAVIERGEKSVGGGALGEKAALVAPLEPAGLLYVEVRGLGSDAGGDALRLVEALAGLLSGLAEEGSAGAGAEGLPGLSGMVGRSGPLLKLLREIEQVAPSLITVHIHGESGTGKELVADALHARSKRAGELVPINAASWSDELFEAELFGHTRGAFTGAVGVREGLVAAADGGTLFIDEVAELSPRNQARLLRFLEKREYYRLGESQRRGADVRVITASNARLIERVAAGAFREDLLFRLNDVEICVPPLRARLQDVPLLARHFLRFWANAEGRPRASLTPAVSRALARYAWPGNVRELRQEMRRLALFCAGRAIQVDDLSPRILVPGERSSTLLKDALLRYERTLVCGALERNAGNRAQTAEDLGITRQALHGKTRRLGI